MTTSQHQQNYSFTEKKRVRKNFGKRRSILEVPFLLAIQVDSYREFRVDMVSVNASGGTSAMVNSGLASSASMMGS